jgi:hypothetical protein
MQNRLEEKGKEQPAKRQSPITTKSDAVLATRETSSTIA